MGNHLFVIFAVLDVSLAVNLCINCSFLHLCSNSSSSSNSSSIYLHDNEHVRVEDTAYC